MTTICKIMSRDDWEDARESGLIAPAAIDRRDGYIHLSTEDQTLETARLHFAGRDDLVAVSFSAEDFGAALKWEASRDGALFPHLYGVLAAADALGARRLVRSADGFFLFGEAIA